MRMYFRFVGDQPCWSGNSARRSDANRWITLAPQPCLSWRSSQVAGPLHPGAAYLAVSATTVIGSRSGQSRDVHG